MDLQRLSMNLVSFTEKLDKMVSDPKVERIGVDAAETVNELKEASRKLNRELDRLQLSKRVGTITDASGDLIQKVGRTVRSTDRLVRRTHNNIEDIFGKLLQSIDDLNYVTRELKKRPSGFSWGPRR